MREISEGELGGGRETRESDIREALRVSAGSLAKAIERGEDYGVHERTVVEGLRGFVEERIEDLIGLVAQLRETVDGLRPVLGDLGEKLASGLEATGHALENGRQWLRENPEVFDAALRLVVLGAIAAGSPAAFMTLVQSRPDVLLEPLAVLAAHVIR